SVVPPDPCAPDPVYAMCRSPMAPARIVGSAAALFNPPGGTISGLETSSRWHAASSVPAPASNAARPHRRRERRSSGPIMSCRMAIMALSSRSEGDVDACDEVPHGRLCQKISRREIVLAGLVQLGIDPVVFRPRSQVTADDREAEILGAQHVRPAGGRKEREGHLAPLRECPILDI